VDCAAALLWLAGCNSQADAAQLPPLAPAGPTTDALEEAVSLLQHHDGITGTAKQHVVNDYHKRVYKGEKWQS
jgi:hypothetical protein